MDGERIRSAYAGPEKFVHEGIDLGCLDAELFNSPFEDVALGMWHRPSVAGCCDRRRAARRTALASRTPLAYECVKRRLQIAREAGRMANASPLETDEQVREFLTIHREARASRAPKASLWSVATLGERLALIVIDRL